MTDSEIENNCHYKKMCEDGLESKNLSVYKFQIVPIFDKHMPKRIIKAKIIDKAEPMFIPKNVKEPLRYYYENEDVGVLNNINIMFSEEDDIHLSMPAEVEWTTPKGGFFIWVTLPAHIDSSDVFNLAVKEGAAFIVGRAFDPEGKQNNSMRLAFSHTSEDRIEEGVQIIAKAVKQVLK